MKKKTLRLMECVFDITQTVDSFHPYEYDINSRTLFSYIVEWAKEFEKTFDCTDPEKDYIEEIEKFAEKKCKKLIEDVSYYR